MQKVFAKKIVSLAKAALLGERDEIEAAHLEADAACYVRSNGLDLGLVDLPQSFAVRLGNSSHTGYVSIQHPWALSWEVGVHIRLRLGRHLATLNSV